MTRRGYIAAPGGPYSARENDVGLGPAKTVPGKIARAQRQGGGLVPAPPFERIARRDGCKRVSHFEVLRLDSPNRIQLIEHAFGLSVLRALQVCISEIVHRVQLLIPCALHAIPRGVSLRRRLGVEVRSNGFLPQSQSREDVRGHVPRMRGGGRDLRIAAGGGKRKIRERRIVVTVNQIVRYAGMLRF